MRQATLLLAVFLFGGNQTQTALSLGDDPATFDAQLDAAFLTHDVALLTAVVAEDAVFTHLAGNRWSKQELVTAARTSQFLARTVDGVQVEPHGDVIQTTGQIQVKTSLPDDPEYRIYFVRLYAHRPGGWKFLSHRTIREEAGP